MLATQLRVLRVFGLSSSEMADILRTAQNDGCPGLRLLEKDGEYAVCVQAQAPNQAMAQAYCDKWMQKLTARFDAGVYGTGEISLARATLDALLKKRRLIAAADAQTGRLLGALLRPLEHSEAAFDFGTQTYGDPEKSKKIMVPPTLLKRYPGDVVQAAAGRAQLALLVGTADFGVAYLPATVGQAPFVVVCDKHTAWAAAVAPDATDAAIANLALDLVRRRTLGLKPSPATVTFRPGRDATPLLLVSQNGRMPVGTPPRKAQPLAKMRKPMAQPQPVAEPLPETPLQEDDSNEPDTIRPETGVKIATALQTAARTQALASERGPVGEMLELDNAPVRAEELAAADRPGEDDEQGEDKEKFSTLDDFSVLKEFPAISAALPGKTGNIQPGGNNAKDRAKAMAAAAARSWRNTDDKATDTTATPAADFSDLQDLPQTGELPAMGDWAGGANPATEHTGEIVLEGPMSAPHQEKPVKAVGGIVFEEPALRDAKGVARPAQKPQKTSVGRSLHTGHSNPAPTLQAKEKAEEKPTMVHTAAAQHSILDDDVPDFEAVTAASARKAMPDTMPRTRDDFRDAAKALFDDDLEDVPATGKSIGKNTGKFTGKTSIRTKEERRERRHGLLVALLLLLLLLLLVGGCVAGFLFLHGKGDTKPAYRGYGTNSYDNAVQNYLGAAAATQPDVAGYLAWPGADGELVHTAAGQTLETPAFGGMLAGDTAQTELYAAPYLKTDWRLAGSTASNTVLDCGSALAGMKNRDTAAQNCGFTLYTGTETYRFKLLAVCYWNEDETALDLMGGDLSGYYRYLAFVTGLHSRSLFDTGVAVGDADRFLTLLSASDEPGVSLCVVGRLIAQNEDARLISSDVKENENPLLTATQYQALGLAAPDTAALAAESLAWYAQQAEAKQTMATADGEAATSADTLDANAAALTAQVEEMQAQTDSIIASADALLAGLTDVAGKAGAAEAEIGKGAEGSLPTEGVAVESVGSQRADATSQQAEETPAPEQPQAEEADSQQQAEKTPEPEATPAPQASSAEGETIDVTMNGSQQTLDLVTCLAMIAQNELGANAPLEAYKAQCVAAHCWILSQGGYPSVLGATPGPAAMQAAQEVAHVLITYNGNVCFTPYFASASTGTASSADVWGGARAYLQAVDSPYDSTVSSNWNTNGSTSGSARFSADAIAAAINEKLGIDLTGVDKNSWFKILSANGYGWVSQMQIGPDGGAGTTTCSGRWFRETLTAGRSVDGRSLRSQCFTFTYDEAMDCFVFDVYGYGHGCGLSQWGAVGYANNGWSYDTILTHYFTGVTLTTY